MKIVPLLAPFLLILSQLHCVAYAQEANTEQPIRISIDKTSANGNIKNLLKNDTRCSKVLNSLAQPANRREADILIICKAFLAVDFNPLIKLIWADDYDSAIAMVEKSKVDMAGTTIWLDDIHFNKAHASIAVVQNREFEKSIFTLAHHPLQSLAHDKIDLSQYVGITLRIWQHDLAALKAYSPNSISTIQVESIYKMLKSGKADYTLLELNHSGTDKFKNDSIELHRVSDAFISLEGSRHFIVSRNLENSIPLLEQLNIGLNTIKGSGYITDLYQKAGFHTASQSQTFKRAEQQK